MKTQLTLVHTPLMLAAMLALVCGACGKQAKEQAAQDAAKAMRPIPVVAAAVKKMDVPIYLDGIGNVSAYKTVTVKTQVDGVLEKVLFREGDPVKRGDVIAQIDARPFEAALHQAEGALARDVATLKNAQLNQTRYKDLLAKKLIPEQQLTDQDALVGQLEGTVVLDKAQIESAKLNLAYARIVSPVDGVTGVRIVDPGNVVHAADVNGLVVITQLDPIAVIFNLPQDNLPDIAPQMLKSELPVEAWSREGATKLGAGRLLLIDNQINTATATLRLKAIFPNPEHKLWPNQFVKARLLVSTRKDALVVAATAVQRGPDGTFAWVVGSDSAVTVRPVEVERSLGDQVVISKGLNEGEQVVVEGQAQLRAGSKVQPRDANARPAAPGSETQAAQNAQANGQAPGAHGGKRKGGAPAGAEATRPQ